MNKVLTPVKVDKVNSEETKTLIANMLKQEKTKLDIQAATGFNSKVVQYIIDRYELEEKLLIPRLVGIR